ncbi:MAG: hypothetical protein CMN37_06155 [SAR116 cluster bacterium]|nr:hypothetical protein [SAR116 cluster bacterium]
MSSDKITTVTKNDLKNVRQLIEKEINQSSSTLLHLDNVVTINEDLTEQNNFQITENINFVIKDQIKKIILEQVKLWFEKNIPVIITPLLRDHLLNIKSENSTKKNATKKVSLKNKKILEPKKKKYDEMSLGELQSEILKEGKKLDKRHGPKKLISLLQKN